MANPRPDDLVRAPASSRALAVSHRARRWRLFRDLSVFQLKLLVDGIKDVVLAPAALAAALAGLVLRRDDPGGPFYALLRWGHAFDRWVDLFGTPSMPSPPPGDPAPPGASPSPPGRGLDAHVRRVEQVLAEQVQRGGLTAKAKEAIDAALDSLPRASHQDPDRPPP